jgi:type II secretory pathway predicted ATPase ExeA
MDYVKFYGLQDEPFRNDPDERFWFEGQAQNAARMRLMRGVHQHKGLCVLVGGPGCGKTSIARHLLDSLDGDDRVVRLLSVPHRACSAGWLLPRIATAFGVVQPEPESTRLLGQLYERLIGLASSGRHPTLLVDEAQLLANVEVMEEFRGLLNLEHEGRKLVSLVLFGLPQLDAVLQLDPPLAQRIDVRVQLGTFDRDDTIAYLAHRMACAGGDPELFTQVALDAICDYSGGIPRLINTLADNSLFEGFLAEAARIDGSLVDAAAEQLGLRTPAAAAAAPANEAPAASAHAAEAPRATPTHVEPARPAAAPPSGATLGLVVPRGSRVVPPAAPAPAPVAERAAQAAAAPAPAAKVERPAAPAPAPVARTERPAPPAPAPAARVERPAATQPAPAPAPRVERPATPVAPPAAKVERAPAPSVAPRPERAPAPAAAAPAARAERPAAPAASPSPRVERAAPATPAPRKPAPPAAEASAPEAWDSPHELFADEEVGAPTPRARQSERAPQAESDSTRALPPAAPRARAAAAHRAMEEPELYGDSFRASPASEESGNDSSFSDLFVEIDADGVASDSDADAPSLPRVIAENTQPGRASGSGTGPLEDSFDGDAKLLDELFDEIRSDD